MDYKNLTSQLVKQCLRSGADAAEVYLQTGRNLTIEVRNSQVETVQEASTYGVGLRVFKGGRMAFASSNDFGETALEEAIRRAVAFAGIMTPDPNNVLPEDKAEAKVEGLYDPETARVPLDDKIKLATNLETIALQVPGVTKSAGATYGEEEGEVFLANSHGLLKSYRSSLCGFGVSVVAEKGEQKSSGGESCRRRFFADLKPAEEVAGKAARDAVAMLDPQRVKTQRAAVIFDRDVAYALLGGILAALNGERVLQGASFLGKRLGQKIAVDRLTFVDDGTLARGLASVPFDGEGVPTQKRVVVEQGILRGYLYNTSVAKRAGVKTTGNASRSGFSSLPGIGAHNFYLAAGTSKVEDIVKATERGLWLKGITGYGINPVNGNFSGGAEGFWVENGKIAFPVKGLTVAGTADEMLNGIDLLGEDLDLNRGMAAPTFRIKALQIGGE
jgi:PmbA protein